MYREKINSFYWALARSFTMIIEYNATKSYYYVKIFKKSFGKHARLLKYLQ